jgi:hypothetical protein
MTHPEWSLVFVSLFYEGETQNVDFANEFAKRLEPYCDIGETDVTNESHR